VAKPPQEISFWPFAGMILMAAAFFLYGASALVAPWWAVALLLLVWLLMFVKACSWWTPHPRRISVLAGVAIALWFVTLLAGATYLDWGA
jgi:signal transduction histidine kinase